MRRLVSRYVKWFNTERITLIHGGLTPAKYCQKMQVA
ncbi:IS3 family transposase [Levilactobacillus sp. 244-2]